MKSTIQIILFLMIILSGFYAFNQNSDLKHENPVDFTLTDTDGNTVNLFTELQNGKTVLLFFFSTSCIHCDHAAPIVDSIYKQFGQGTQNLLVWGIAYQHANIEMILDFKSRTGIEFPCFPTGHADDVFSFYNIEYTPQIKIICNDEVSPPIPQNEIVENLSYCFNTTSINKFESLNPPYSYYENNHITIFNFDKEITFYRIISVDGLILAQKQISENSVDVNLQNYNGLLILQLFYNNSQVKSYKILKTSK
ncbi:MAG: TlpA disulfide reductase family protein [Bacteroidales bacterium]|nr:TlpA disulfide reductase family protein [Bacteroidales bacterium]HOL98130.1 TlpA disulfide reductase family protein [Bacteroidales bacterium]HOM36239.1 TlpA disulfide reductase family protein [Bacteroidales bacterium]HPD23770.1 TlpA disulfide reductase family protein [Bacteroidales bacterium]HRS99752.1 TlpA disulfide reductase family protein [Bacteroidales bacterium]